MNYFIFSKTKHVAIIVRCKICITRICFFYQLVYQVLFAAILLGWSTLPRVGLLCGQIVKIWPFSDGGLAANIFLAFWHFTNVFENWPRVLNKFVCGSTFWNLKTQNASMGTLTSTLPFLTVEITHANISNPENGNS